MVLLVKVLGIVVIVLSLIFILRAEMMKKFMAYCLEDKNITMIAVLRIIIGLFLLIASTHCSGVLIVVIIGLLTLAAGIVPFMLGFERVKIYINTLMAKPLNLLRLLALIPLVAGILLVYSA